MGSTYNAPVHNVAASGTQYTTPVTAEDDSTVSYVVEHPAGTTTVYTHQISNSSKADIHVGLDKWVDDSGITVPSKSAAEDFAIDPSPCNFRRSRLKMVTSAGAGVIKVSAFVKRG